MNWINDFNPQNVNYKDLSLPQNLRNLDEYSRVAARDYPKNNRITEVQREQISQEVKSSFGLHVTSRER